MPFLRDLARQQGEAHEAGRNEDWNLVTTLAIGVIAIYGLAEDMGYEW